MMKLPIKIETYVTIWQKQLAAIDQARTLNELLSAAWQFACQLTLWLVEQHLAERAQQPTTWGSCPECGRRLESKGLQDRTLRTAMGELHWRRRVGRCPKKCQIGQIAPLDDELGLAANQRMDEGIKRKACLLAVFVPFETAAVLLEQLSGMQVSTASIWQWVQQVGQQLNQQLEAELEALAAGQPPAEETLSAELATYPLVIGGDGVMVPFRPQRGSRWGKTIYREVKVGILARLVSRLNQTGKLVSRLEQRRLVAVVGALDQFGPRLWLEAVRQGIDHAPQVIWLSDGAKGLWGLFDKWFAGRAQGVLDFYHAAQHLWTGALVWLDGRTKRAKAWFAQASHRLRHGQAPEVLQELQSTLALPDLPESTRETLTRVYNYLDRHRDHIDYAHLKDLGLPIGSGLVESACKWLIQQRFKGVGMRWAEDSFTHLLLLRLAWVNGRFDACFSSFPKL
jgi:hypothetical protein